MPGYREAKFAPLNSIDVGISQRNRLMTSSITEEIATMSITDMPIAQLDKDINE